jgi:hypothetical protein
MTIYRDDLERVYALIEKPEAWTQGAYARDAAGELIPREESGDAFADDEFAPLRDAAACFCLYGAGIRCGLQIYEFGNALGIDVVGFNDAPNRTHSEVLALLRSAIDRAPVRPATP